MASDPKKLAALIVGGPKEEDPRGESDDAMGDDVEVAAQELLSAIDAKDATGVASALRSAFQMLESEPHDEADTE